MATLSAFLADLQARIEPSRRDPQAYALAHLARAEHEPILGHRFDPVRAAIDEAGQALADVDDPQLRARLLLRVAELKLVESDLEAADRTLARVEDVAGPGPLRFIAAVRGCRVAIRRSPEHRVRAREILAHVAAGAPLTDDGDPMWGRAAGELALAFAELEANEMSPSLDAFVPLREIVSELGNDPAHADLVFTARQLLVVLAFSVGDYHLAMTHLRGVLELAVAAASYPDEIHARLTLAAALSEDPEVAAQQEAAHHAQRARDRALEHGLHDLHRLALIAQAGVLSNAGKTAGAIDRMLELAQSAVADGDVTRYVSAVGLMAALYTKAGDATSAFRTLAESNHALGAALGKSTSHMFAPHLATLRAQVGADRLREIASAVAHANQLAAELAGPDAQ